MNTPEKSFEHNGHSINMYRDPDPISSREWDNICVIHVAHKQYSFGDVNHGNHGSIDKEYRDALKRKDIVFPLFMYDHSAITVSLTPFQCDWDSGQVGIVVVPYRVLIKEFGDSILSGIEKKAREVAENEVKELDTFLTGEVYGYIIYEGTEHEEGFWGIHGEEECIDDIKDVMEHIDCMVT